MCDLKGSIGVRKLGCFRVFVLSAALVSVQTVMNTIISNLSQRGGRKECI